MVYKKAQSQSKGFGHYLSSWIEFTIELDQGLTLSNRTVQMCEFIWFIQLMTVLELHLDFAKEQVGENVENYLQLIISPLYTLGVYQVVILVIPLAVLTIVNVRLFIKTVSLKDKIQSQEKSQLIQLLNHATCLINKLMASILYIPANSMLIRSFWIAVKQIADGDLTFLTHLIIIIVLQGLFLLYFVGRSLCLEQMLIKGDFNKLSVPLSVYLNYALQFLLILSCGSLNHSDLNNIVIILLSFLYISIYLWQTLFEQLHVEDSHKRQRLILASCYTVYVVVGVIMLFDDQRLSPNGALLFLATPPLVKLLMHYYDLQLIDMISWEKRQRSQYMQMLYATTLLNMHRHRQGNIVLRAIVIKSHQCKYPDEVCKQPTQSYDGIIMFKNQQLEEIILHNCYNMILSAVDMKDISMQFTYRILAVQSLCVIGRVNQAQMLVQMLLSTQKSSNSSTQDTRTQALLNQHWNTILYTRLPDLSRLQQTQLKCIHNKLNALLIQRMELSIPEQGSYESSSLKKGVSLFFESERHNKHIVKQVLSLLEDKLHFMIYMANQQNFNGNRACHLLKSLSNRIMIIEEQFISLYQAFPSFFQIIILGHRMQSIVLLLESEVLHNYLKAWQLCSFATLEDDSVRKITNGIKIDLLRNNVTYIVSNLDGDHNRLLVDRISPSAIRYFGYSKQQLAKLDSVERLMPNVVSAHHPQFVKRFLAEGHSKYFRQVSTTTIKDVQGHLQFVEMFFDVNQQGGGLSFITFIQGIQNPPSCLLVTSNGSIDSASESLLNDMSIITNISQSIISRSVLNQKIDQLLSITREQFSSDQIDSLTGNYIWKIPVDSKFLSSNITFIELQSFIEIEHRQIEALTYYLFKVTDIQPVAYQSQTSTVYQTLFDVPHESSGIGPLMTKLNNQPQPRNFLSVGTPREILNINPDNHYIQNLVTDQQYFFSIDDQPENKLLLTHRSQIVSPRKREFDKETLQKPAVAVDSRFVEFTKEQAYMDRNKPELYEQSIASSIAGIRRSEFFKKYDRITQFISDKSQHKMIKLLTYIHILKFSLCIIYASIVLSMIDKDVAEIRSEFDTLQVNRLFIEPLDQYAVIRYAIIGYEVSLAIGQITYESYNSYLGYNQLIVNYTFDRLIQNMHDGLTNPDLQKFLVDRYSTVKILKAQFNSSDFQPVEFNLSIREVVQLTLIYEYYDKMQSDFKVTTGGSGQSYFYFYFRNYFTLRTIFLDLARSVGDFSHQYCEYIMSKWITVYIPFLIIIVLLYLAEWVMLALYYNRIERILGWFTNPINQVRFLKDIDSLEGLIKLLKSDHQLVYQYRFDLEKQEEALKQQISMTKIKNQDGKNINLQPGKYFNFSLPLIIAIGLFVAYSSIVTTQMRDHTEKYNQTIDFYQLMSDTSVAIPALFNQRETLYYFFILPFFNATDRMNYHKAIDANLELLNNFVDIIQMFDGKKILAESDFVVTFDKALKGSLCNFLNAEISNVSQATCNSTFGGILQRGLLPTLNDMINSIRYDKSSNNFTTRALYPINEIEGTFLASQAIDTLHAMLKGSMEKRTDQVHKLIQVLSIVFLIFELILLALVLRLVIHYYINDFLLYRRSLMLLSPSVLYSDQLERFIRIVQSQDMT